MEMIAIHRCKMEELLKVELGDDDGHYVTNLKSKKAASQLIGLSPT